MGAEQIILIVNSLLSWAWMLYEKAEQIKTKDIPTWEEISGKNARLQAKIDIELGTGGGT